MRHVLARGFFVLLIALAGCGSPGTVANAPAGTKPDYVPAALAHVAIPPAPMFAIPRPPDAAMRASRDASGASPSPTPTPPPFFDGQQALSNNVYYLAFPSSGNYFGYYSYLSNPAYIYHFDAGYEYVFDANDGMSGVYFYDFASSDFWYTSPSFPFPYLYDFTLKSVLYYYPDPNNPGHYNTNGTRYFYEFATGKIITL